MVEAAPAEQGTQRGAEPFVLLPWEETFIARYPRAIKVGLVLGVLIMFTALRILVVGLSHERHRPPPKTNVVSADSRNSFTPTKGQAKQLRERSFDPGAPALNEQDDHNVKMVPAPDPYLSDDRPEGSLPKIGEDGRQPWQVYARPFDAADRRPRIAIVLVDLGLSRGITDAAINRMPANVTMVFDAQNPIVGAWCTRARQDGHEVFISLPMEPFDYPLSDPGPQTLLTSMPTSNNLERLYAAMRRATGYVGVTTLTGSRFTTDPTKLTPILDVMHDRGLMVFDAHMAPHSAMVDLARDKAIPVAEVTQRFDQNLSPAAIDASLAQLEQTALISGYAVGMAAPTPVVLDRLQEWLKELPARGVALAPLSAMTM